MPESALPDRSAAACCVQAEDFTKLRRKAPFRAEIYTWSAPFLQGLGVAFRVQIPPEGAQTQTRALIQFRGEATF